MTLSWRALAQKNLQRYFDDVSVPRCPQCGAELFAEARFCRQCGVTVVTNSSELPTAVLGQKIDIPTTQRLDPRPTSPEHGALVPPVTSVGSGKLAGRKLPATLVLGVVIVVVLIGIASSVAYVRIRSHSQTTDAAALMYPGSRTIVDMSSDGGRAIHLETGDPLEKVVKWYDASLKPTKTMRLTSTSIVMKNQNVTATIAAEAGKTNILIKQVLTP